MARNSGFTVGVTLLFALGIGATTSIFSIVHGVLLRPLPYPEPERLVFFSTSMPGIGSTLYLTEATYVVASEKSQTLQSVAGYRSGSMNVVGARSPERVTTARVTGSLFTTLAAAPALGRALQPADDLPGAPPVAVLSDGLWKRLYAANPVVVGTSMEVEGTAREIVGVMRPGFDFPDGSELWIPLTLDHEAPRASSWHQRVIGRLADGASADEAAAELDRLFDDSLQLYASTPSPEFLDRAQPRIQASPLRERVVGDVGGLLWAVLAAVALTLLIACASVANVLLVRSERRSHEVAVRTAVGASHGSLVRLFFIESLLLGLAGGVVGLGVASAALEAILAWEPGKLPRLDAVGIDLQVLLFATTAALLCGLLTGLAPVVQLPVRRLADGLGSVGIGSGVRKPHHKRLLGGLVATQIAFALIAVAGSVLMLRTSWNLAKVEIGFDPDSVLTFRLDLPEAYYPEERQVVDFHMRAIERLRAMPGVVSAGAAGALPLDPHGTYYPGSLWLVDASANATESTDLVWRKPVTPGFFRTLSIPLRAGRVLERSDAEAATGALVVSESFAARYYAGSSDAVGRRIRFSEDESSAAFTIVGVVGNVRERAIGRDDPELDAVYWALQGPEEEMAWAATGLSYALRTSGPPEELLPSLRRVLRELDPSLPLAHPATMQQFVSASMARTTFSMTLLAIGGLFALVISSVGIYGVVSYLARRRIREIGVRMALGAERREITAMIVRHAASIIAVGVALGLAGASLGTRLLAGLLFGVEPTDLGTLAAAAAVLATISFLSSYLPARRAAAVSPLRALREP